MTQVTVTLTFNSTDEAAAFLAGKSVKAATPAPAPKTEAPAPSARTAEAAPAAAPAAKEEKPAKTEKALDFDKDVVEHLKAYSKTVPREEFAALMKKLGVSKVPELKGKPEVWADIMALSV